MTAWTGMVVARTQTVTVAEAVETTFDGKHPCRLCSAISSGQKEETKQDRESSGVKKTVEVKFVGLEPFELPKSALISLLQWPDFGPSAQVRHEAPPTPPPLA